MIAGAGPTPPTPNRASAGTAVASADNGTIRRPNSAIDGIVCSRLRTAKSGPCKRRRRAAATPSGKPISTAGPTAAATRTMWRSTAAAKTSCRVLYSCAKDSASNQPAPAIAANAPTSTAAAASRSSGPAAARCSASMMASAAAASSTQNPAPSEIRTSAGAPAASAPAAWPAAASTLRKSPPARIAAARCIVPLGGASEIASNASPSAAMPRVRRGSSTASSATGCPETSRFGASATKPEASAAATDAATRTSKTSLRGRPPGS